MKQCLACGFNQAEERTWGSGHPYLICHLCGFRWTREWVRSGVRERLAYLPTFRTGTPEGWLEVPEGCLFVVMEAME